MLNDLLPTEFYLGQNYPNPFRERTTIKYCVPQVCRVLLTVRSEDGQILKTLVDEEREPGTYEVQWEPESTPAGIYEYRMDVSTVVITKSLTLSHELT